VEAVEIIITRGYNILRGHNFHHNPPLSVEQNDIFKFEQANQYPLHPNIGRNLVIGRDFVNLF
jgi:hypothetical protein